MAATNNIQHLKPKNEQKKTRNTQENGLRATEREEIDGKLVKTPVKINKLITGRPRQWKNGVGYTK